MNVLISVLLSKLRPSRFPITSYSDSSLLNLSLFSAQVNGVARKSSYFALPLSHLYFFRARGKAGCQVLEQAVFLIIILSRLKLRLPPQKKALHSPPWFPAVLFCLCLPLQPLGSRCMALGNRDTKSILDRSIQHIICPGLLCGCRDCYFLQLSSLMLKSVIHTDINA